MAETRKPSKDDTAKPQSDESQDSADSADDITSDTAPGSSEVEPEITSADTAEDTVDESASAEDDTADTSATEERLDPAEADPVLMSPPDGSEPAKEDAVEVPEAVDDDTTSAPDDVADDRGLDLPPEPRTEVVERVVEHRGGFGPALIGGIIAALLGFLAAKSNVLDPVLPESWRTANVSGEIETLTSDMSAQSEALKSQNDQITALRADLDNRPPIDLQPLQELMTKIDSSISTLETNVEDISQRLTTLEKQPIEQGISPEAIAAYEREIEQLKDSVATQRTEMESILDEARKMQSEASEREAGAARAEAIARLTAAVQSGGTFSEPLDALGAAGATVPEALSAQAASGVPTMSELRASYPEAARAALATARDGEDSSGGGLGAYLRRQLGARSVQPRDGGDTDAILSRAEAALSSGALNKTLDELDTLPDAAKSAMSDWIAQARTRASAIQAVDTLATPATSN